MRQTLVAGNWKMNGTLATARALAEAIREGVGPAPRGEVALCPPFVYLEAVARLIEGSPLQLGAQNVSEHDPGAYTGEVAAPMLVDVGCRYVIVGHSERRALYGESDAVVARKFLRALDEGLTPVVCVGETLAEREKDETEGVVARQVEAVLSARGAAALEAAVLAYEPVWAIGTGKTASPEQAQAVHAFIRERVARGDPRVAESLRILYGGSVKSANARELFGAPDIDGGLVGGASLNADEFVAICEATS